MILLQNIITDIITKCNSSIITRCDKNLLQNASGFYFKMRQFHYKILELLKDASILLQNAIVVTKRVGTGDLKSFQDPLNPVA